MNGVDRMSKQIIIAAFPCSGKTHLLKSNDGSRKIVGLDEHVHSVIKHPSAEEILNNNKDADILLITAHAPALQFLEAKKLDYVLVYPEKTDECKAEWYNRNKARGSAVLGHRIKMMWKPALDDLNNNKTAKAHYTLKANEYLSDIIDRIVEEQSSASE